MAPLPSWIGAVLVVEVAAVLGELAGVDAPTIWMNASRGWPKVIRLPSVPLGGIGVVAVTTPYSCEVGTVPA